MLLRNLTRTTSFKLVLLYVLVFSASVLALAALTYFVATSALDQQIRARIQAESDGLRGEYASGGLHQLLGAVEERRRGRLRDGLVYTIFDSHDHRVFGTLPASSLVSGWSEVRGPPDGDEPAGETERLAVLGLKLPGNEWVLVADDIGRVSVLGDVVLRAFGVVVLLSVTIAIIGGFVLSLGFLRQVEAISNTAEAIIAGDLRRRVPLRSGGDELDRLAATLNRMLDRITNLMESLRQVSNDIAHDLRTPLGRLRQDLEEVRRTPRAAGEYERAIDQAIRESDDILETFGALLRIAQIESGSRKSGFRVIDLSELVEQIADTYRPVAEDEGRTLLAITAPNVKVEGDRELLAQMIVNLVENAIAHTRAGTTIKLLLERVGKQGVLTVSDNGPGVPQDELQNIFKRFYRLEPSRGTPGNGLGLSLVDAIADLHGLTIETCGNAPGLRVSLTFKLAESVLAAVQ
ncbi:MAG: sensor histidine kinase [Rhizomicrobium sp.]